jgi:hypothetical protein
MRRIVRYLAISVLAAVLITGASFLVGEGVVASVPGGHGTAGTANVYGFPIPYATFFPCCGGGGGPGYSVFMDNTYFYQPMSFAADFGIWLAIAFAATYVFTVKTLLFSAAAGLGATLLTLLAPPLSLVAPTPGVETDVLRPMGFPFEYLTYYSGGLLNFTSSSYNFDLSAALADYGLWTGIMFVGVAVAVAAFHFMRYQRSLDSRLQPETNSIQVD